ncbi:hypothetical protein [Paenibacillus abyssi]|uniref:Uncharacterized protein n=1 Tax=Paenibacillus abyssi TaxID=1340531 RepID=A0A917CSH4_9BACL|nr:hypothetical protein [Paenibacillus abyssi]GGF95450.1 hypothetical protein GCM10010916_10980 [Paenibacillus abyssi]
MTEQEQYVPRLLIKQVIGRLLFDTSKGSNPFELAEADGGWRVVIEQVGQPLVDELQELIDDLNLFYFEELKSDPSKVRKWWLYDKQRPRLQYDAAAQRLEVIVDTRVAYSNDKVIAN